MIEILTIKNENKIEILVISKLSLFGSLSYNMTNFEVTFEKKKRQLTTVTTTRQDKIIKQLLENKPIKRFCILCCGSILSLV